MSPRISSRGMQSGRSRLELLTAWTATHVGRLPNGQPRPRQEIAWITQRLKTHVSFARVLAPDIPRSVCLGNMTKVAWTSEPTSPDGDGIDRFREALDRLGPVAVCVVEEGLRILASDDYREALVRAGVEDRSGKFGVGDWTAKSGRGHRVFAALSQAICEEVEGRPHTPRTVARQVQDPLGVVASVRGMVITRLVEMASSATQLLASLKHLPGGFRPVEHMSAARKSCDSSCPRDRVRVAPTEDELVDGLLRLIERWARKPETPSTAARTLREWTAPFSAGMVVRFAHTLIDGDYYLPRWQVVVDEYTEAALPRLNMYARRSPLGEADRDDLVAASAAEALVRLQHDLLDAYVDFMRVPVLREVTALAEVAPDGYPQTEMTVEERQYWSGRVDAAIDLRGTEELILGNDVLPGGDLAEAEQNFGVALASPWDAGQLGVGAQPGDLDAVERDYWRNRDAEVIHEAAYVELVRRQEKEGAREPRKTIEEIVLLATILAPAAVQELGVVHDPANAGSGAGPDLARSAVEWIAAAEGLGSLLRHGYRQTADSAEGWHARVDRGTLYRGADIESAVAGWCPTDWKPRFCTDLALVVQRAVMRAVVVAAGVRALRDVYADYDRVDAVPAIADE